MSSEYSELQPLNGWDLLASLGHSSKFQRFSRFGFVTAGTSLNKSRPKFALCSAVSWPGIPYIHFRQLLSRDGTLPRAKFTLCLATHHRTSLSGYIFGTKACIDNRKKVLSSNISFICPHNMVNFGPLTAKIDWRVWGTPSYFNGYRVLAALLHGTLLVGVSQTLRRWTEGAPIFGRATITLGIGPHF